MWENYGEDCYLNAEMGREAVLGFQGDDPNNIGSNNMAVTLKIKGSDLAFVGYDGKWILEEGDFRIQAGDQILNIVCMDTKKWDTPNK